MNRLTKFYDGRVAPESRNDFLTQVGHTLWGKPISQQQFDLMVAQLSSMLEIGPEDRVLDLCCGNGIITQHLARHARCVVGVDFSEALIGVAREHHQPDNTSYRVLDALKLEQLTVPDGEKFDKVLMHAALQHFQTSEFERLIGDILAISVDKPLIVISYIPEKSKRKLFYNTPKRRLSRLIGRIGGLDTFGTWWAHDFIETTCKMLDRQCQFLPVNEELEVARYRFNVAIT